MSTMTAPQISENILSPLRRIARRHGFLVAVRCVLQTITLGLLVLLAVALLLGKFSDLMPILRLPIVVLTWAGIVALGYYAIRPAFRGWSVDRAALEVEHSLPQVQERISSAVELSSDQDARFSASQTLIAHLISQAEEDAGNIQPQMVVKPKGLLFWSLALAPIVAIWVIAVAARPLTMEAGLYRVFMPWKALLPPFLARISVSPGSTAINQGDPLLITLNLSPESKSISDAPGAATLVKRFTSGQVLAQDLTRASSLQFTANLPNVEQGFDYQVTSAAGNSPWYTVTVRARPAIAGVDLTYEYPKYTGMAPKTVSAPDGAIDAVIGTKVRITLHSTQPLNERSRLTLNPGTPEAADLPLEAIVPGKTDYQATIAVKHSGAYHFVLINADELQAVADANRTITARPDEPPAVAILSPHEADMLVRSDDMVPIHYHASDDFGVAKVMAMISVDDKPIAPLDLIFDPSDRRNVNGQFDLSVTRVLQLAHVESAHRISYQFQVWDNRDPDPQSATTVKQTLSISEQPIRSYESQLEAKDANHLVEAIRQAINRLDDAENRIRGFVNLDPSRGLDAGQRQAAEEIKSFLTKTAGDLTNAADDAISSEMADMATKAQDIAAHPITDAAGSIAKAQLDADDGTQRQQDVVASGQQVADARKQLQDLLDNVTKTEQRSEAARDLAQAAKDQEKAAQDMAQHPDQAAKNQQEQQKADQELQQAMNEDPALKQDQKAQSTADKLAELQKKVDELHDSQNHASQATGQQQAPDNSKLAAAQKALNDQIEQFKNQRANDLQQAKAAAPPADQQNQIVNDLNGSQIASAADRMKSAVSQLTGVATKLQQSSATTQPFTAQQQDKLNADQQAQDTAKTAQTQAEQAATALNQETQQPAANDPAIQQAEQSAQAIGQQAQNLKPQGNDATDARNNALQQAQRASADAQAAQNAQNPADATKAMQQAAQELRHASAALVQAEQQSAAADQQAMQQQQAQASQQAAAQAQSLAQQQEALLQQAQPNEQAAKDESNQQQQIAQANQDAQDLQQQAQNEQNDDVAQRVGNAQPFIQQANTEAQQATANEHNNQPQQAAQHEANAAHQLALADNALRQPPPQLAVNPDNADPDQHLPMDDQERQQGQPNQQGQPDQQANAQDPGQHGMLDDTQHPNGQSSDQNQQQGQNMQGQPDQGQSQQGQNQQGQNQQRQNQQGQNQQGQNQQGQQQANAAQQGQQQGSQQQQGEHQGNHPGGAQSANGQQTADSAHHSAAEEADAAQHSQQQAGQSQSQQSAQAAQEAAQELAMAAHEMQQSVPGQQSSDQPGYSSDSHSGRSTQRVAAKPIPAAVSALGVSSRVWAKLRPLEQQDLLNAAQQNSLPAYRESVKNYFEKIARLRDSSEQQQNND